MHLQNRQVNAIDSRIFWYSMYITLSTWVVFAFVAIIGFKVSWAVLALVAVFMNAANVVGYTKCEKVWVLIFESCSRIDEEYSFRCAIQDAKNKIANYLAGQSAVQGWVGSMVSNQLGSMFTGTPQPPVSRV